MKFAPLLLALTFFCLPAFASEEALIEPATALDQAAKTDHVELKPSVDFPIDAETPPGSGDIACHYYQHVMVKQIDTGEKGAAQLGWTVVKDKDKPACVQEAGSNEYILTPDSWSGYFESAKWPYLFFGADDGSAGGMGFAVFHAENHKKVLEDIAIGNVELQNSSSGVKLKYKRAWRAPCSVIIQGKSCWESIAHTLNISPSPTPDCNEGYLKQKTDMAEMRCQSAGTDDQTCLQKELKVLDAQKWNEAPSVISYMVEVTLKGSDSTTKPTGGDIGCYPSE